MTALPPLLAQTLSDLTDEVVDAIQTDTDHFFSAHDTHAPIWLVLTAEHLIEAAALPDGIGWSWTHSLNHVRVGYTKGMIKDTITLDETSYPLPIGSGKRGKHFVRAINDQQTTQHKHLSPLTSLWFDTPPDALSAVINRDLEPDDLILAAASITPGDHLANAQQGWLILSARNTRLYWWSDTSSRGIENAQCMAISDDLDIRLESSLTRDAYYLGDLHLFGGPLLGTGPLREITTWSSLPPKQRLLAMAIAAIEQNRWLGANELLSRAQHISDDQEVPATFKETLLIQRARVSFQLSDDRSTLKHLIALTEHHPHDDLMALTNQTFTPPQGWWLVVGLAHEEAQDYHSAATIYGHIAQQDKSLDAFILQQARCFQLAEHTDDAIASYRQFIKGRVDGNEFSLISYYAQHADALEETSSDPDLAAACGELGQLLEQTQRLTEAAEVYLMLIRQAPFDHLGYEHLFRLADQLEGHHQIHAAQAASIARILDPKRTRALFEDLEIAPIHWNTHHWLTQSQRIDQTQHDEQIVHEGERASSALAQKWLSHLITDPRSTSDIELHCQRLTFNTHEALLQSLDVLATSLEMTTPRIYLSHGMSGVQVMGTKEAPFVLMGAIHLQEQTQQTLTHREQVFALAAQMEHIKAGHLVLTSSEFWGAFRSRSLDGIVTALSLIPIGGMLGKVTDKFAGSLIEKLRLGWDNAMVKQAVTYAEKSLKDGTGGHVQGAYEATLGRMALLGKKNVAQESLLKEQLADFARCAMYTSDRVGLIAADDLVAAVRAILLLSVRTHIEVDALGTEGLSAVLNQKHDNGELVYTELALRFGELFKFALSDEYLSLRTHLHGALRASELTDDQAQDGEAMTPQPDATTP